MQAKRALLIGIDAYPHVPPLDGCVNDVGLMRQVLVECFGFPPDAITTLTNAQATRAGILQAFDALITATGTDDIVVIHYAGHGSQMTDREGDEPSGFDSTILPVDSARAPGANLDITDDEIHLKLEALGEKTAFTTLVFDSCHSGTITRDAFGAKARSVEPDRRPASELPPSPIPSGRASRSASGASGWMPLSGRYVLIAGCRDDERSYEYRPPEAGGAVAHGALTYFLCEQLRQAASGTTYRDVFERAAARVNGENREQHPQMEGSADREVFGVAELRPAAFVRIAGRDGGTVRLAAGAAHGLTTGSTYAVFPQGTKAPAGAASLGAIEVVAVRAISADARITNESGPGAIGPDARAFETMHAYGHGRLLVQIVPAAGQTARIASLQAAIERSRELGLGTDGAEAAARIYLLPARAEVNAASEVPQAGRLGEPRWGVVGGTGDLLMPLKPLDDVTSVVDNLELVARYRRLLATENPDPRSRLRGRFTVDLLRRGPEGDWIEAPPDAAGHIVFDEGDTVAIRVSSRHDEAAHFALIDVGLSGAVSVVQQGEVLAPGVAFMVGADGDLPLTFPPGYPFIDSVDHLREAEGVETLKLFVTKTPVDFAAVEQTGVRSADAASPLSALLRDAVHGPATRDIARMPVGADDWTTVSRSFVLRRRTSAPLGAGVPVSLGTATVSASGLSGTLTIGLGKAARIEAARAATDAMQAAFDEAGIETKQTLEVAGLRERPSATRDAAAEPSIALELQAPEPGYGQIVLAVDELGVVSWCLPETAVSTRGGLATATRTYRIPAGVAGEAPRPGTRGLIDVVGKKVLKELVFPLIDPIVGEVTATFVNRVEQRRTPYRARTFTPDDYARADAPALDAGGWARLAEGRALLMVHGTASRSHLAFQQLPRDYVDALGRLYGGRVFAFDHFTLSHDPKENVRRLCALLPDGADLDLDIVSHSRGGLVSRVLTERQDELPLGGRRLRIGKVVFVGVPSAGTVLADPAHVARATDVLTNLMNFLPDNGLTEPVSLVLSVLKQLAVGALTGLDGLHAMQPGGAFTRWLNTGGRTGDTRYFAVASNVTPVDPGLRRLVVRYGLNQLFDGANDYVVPAGGVYAANGSGYFPIADRLVLEGDDAAAHTRYFSDARVRERIFEWLRA